MFIQLDHYFALTDPVHYPVDHGPRKSTCWVVFISVMGLAYASPLLIVGYFGSNVSILVFAILPTILFGDIIGYIIK